MARAAAVIGMLILMVGCQSFDKNVSMNVQRAGLNGAAKVGISVALDMQKPENVEVRKTEIVAVAEQIKSFLDTGSVADLTSGELKIKLIGLVPEKYRVFVDQMMGVLSMYSVPAADKLGSVNLKRIRAFLNGTIQGCNEYKMEDRTDAAKGLMPGASPEEDTVVDNYKKFGAELAAQ